MRDPSFSQFADSLSAGVLVVCIGYTIGDVVLLRIWRHGL